MRLISRKAVFAELWGSSFMHVNIWSGCLFRALLFMCLSINPFTRPSERYINYPNNPLRAPFRPMRRMGGSRSRVKEWTTALVTHTHHCKGQVPIRMRYIHCLLTVSAVCLSAHLCLLQKFRFMGLPDWISVAIEFMYVGIPVLTSIFVPLPSSRIYSCWAVEQYPYLFLFLRFGISGVIHSLPSLSFSLSVYLAPTFSAQV